MAATVSRTFSAGVRPLHADHPEAWPVTDAERADWVGARVSVSADHACGPATGEVVGVWRGLGFGGKWHILADTGDQFGAFTGELERGGGS